MGEPEKYTQHLIVTEDDLDQLNHVNNVVYLKWVQQVAESHWRVRASEILQSTLIWVVLSHFIEYKKPAKLGDELRLETYVTETHGVRSTRHVEIYREDTLLAQARTEWCLVHKATLKPTRVTDEIVQLFKY